MNFKQSLPELEEKDINHYYELLSKTFISRETHCNKACIESIKGGVEGTSILDVAAGRGYMARTLYNENNSLNCTVSDIVLPEKSDRVAGITYIKGSITNLPFEDDEFDTVICTHALEHIKDTTCALDEIRRVCRRKLLIVLPRQREYKYTYDLHVNFYPYKYNVEMLMNSGHVQKRENISVSLLSGDWMVVETMRKGTAGRSK